jgi:hypothetical protein
MKALRLPVPASPAAYLFRFRGPRDSSSFVLASLALPGRRRSDPGRDLCSAGCPFAGVLSRGRERNLTGSQAIHPMPLPRSKTPAGSTAPHHDGAANSAPAKTTTKAPAALISRLLTGFSICCLRFENGVAAVQARLASGWLVGLCREGVEPSGSQRKVSERHLMLIPLSRAFPVARFL